MARTHESATVHELVTHGSRQSWLRSHLNCDTHTYSKVIAIKFLFHILLIAFKAMNHVGGRANYKYRKQSHSLLYCTIAHRFSMNSKSARVTTVLVDTPTHTDRNTQQ